MASRPTRPFWIVLRIALGVALLFYVLESTGGWASASLLFTTAWLLPGFVAFTLLGATVEAKRLCLLLRSQSRTLAFKDSLGLVVMSVFFSLCIPGGTGGDLIKLYYLAQDDLSRGVEMATVILVDRAVGLFSMLLVVVLLASLNWRLLLEPGPLQVMTLVSIAGLLAMTALALLSWSPAIRKTAIYRWVTGSVPFKSIVNRVLDALHLFRDHRGAVVQAILLSTVGQLALATSFAAAGTVLVPDAPLLTTALLSLLGLIANWIPLTPGGLGVGEAAFAGLFRLAGYHGGEKLLLAWRVGMLPLAVVGGLLYVVHPGRRPRDVGTV
jgi:uncharacterized protein (TIRG00374 family)